MRWSAACVTSSVSQALQTSIRCRCSSRAGKAAWGCSASAKTSQSPRACRPHPSRTQRWRASDKALPFRGAMGLETHAPLRLCVSAGLRVCVSASLRLCVSASLRLCGSAGLQESWPSVKGLADSTDDAAEWGASRTARPCAWRPCSGQSHMWTRTPAVLPSLQRLKQTRRGPLHRPCPLAQLRRVASVSMAHSTAWPSGAHSCRLLHQRTPAPRQRSLCRSRRRCCVCLW